VNGCTFPFFIICCEQDGPEVQGTEKSRCSGANPCNCVAERRQESLTSRLFFQFGVKLSVRNEM